MPMNPEPMTPEAAATIAALVKCTPEEILAHGPREQTFATMPNRYRFMKRNQHGANVELTWLPPVGLTGGAGKLPEFLINPAGLVKIITRAYQNANFMLLADAVQDFTAGWDALSARAVKTFKIPRYLDVLNVELADAVRRLEKINKQPGAKPEKHGLLERLGERIDNALAGAGLD